MQYLFKTRYEDDIRFLKRTGEKIRVGIVIAFVVLVPFLFKPYYVAEIGLLMIYAIAGIGAVCPGLTQDVANFCPDP